MKIKNVPSVEEAKRMSKTLKRIEELKRQALDDLLRLLTDGNVKKFHRIFGYAVSDDQLDDAIRICERTVQKNKETDMERLKEQCIKVEGKE